MTTQTSTNADDVYERIDGSLFDAVQERFELVHLGDEEQPIDARRLFDLEQRISEELLAPLFEQVEELAPDVAVALSTAYFLRDELEKYIDLVADELEESDEEDEELSAAQRLVSDPQAAADPRLVEMMTEVIVLETLEAADPADALALLAAQVESGRYLCDEQIHDPRLCAVGKQMAWAQLSQGDLQIDRSSDLWARALYVVAELGQPVLPALTLIQ